MCRIGGKPENFHRSFKSVPQKILGSTNAKTTTCVSPSYPHSSDRIIVRMTQRQTHAYGVAIPSSRQPLLKAMLRVFAWLVSNVASMVATIFNRNTRDWHTGEAREGLLPISNDLHNKEACQAEPTGLTSGSGPLAAFPAKAWIQTPHQVRTRTPNALRALTGLSPPRGMRPATCALLLSVLPGEGAKRRRPGTQGLRAISLPAHTDERRYPGRTANLVPTYSFKTGPTANPFLDSDASS
jgi:hypothetical protein